METSKLKTYAPKARRDFIAAVTRRAAKFGLTAKGVSPNREEGQLVFIEGQPYPKSVGVQRAKLAERIAQQGFQQVMEAAAYTWFNRFAAIRYMELHGYLDHSFRVLSPSPQRGEGRGEGGMPEILDQAQHVDLPGLDRERVITLKMDGTRDEDLYRDLLLAQCHALHQAMPFLFERLDDETELLLPDNLLQTDSLIRELGTAIPEEDWQEIEIIGWLYQFYISEKKDQVIGKMVASEDIPAATQLFTPNWIVKYMVQNSLGVQWLATYPDSPLKGQMAYYIEPAEQTPEVGAALAAMTPASLDPEALTLMDPACGSGHILVEGYELFKAIYLERGYRLRDIPRLILEKNLFGLDIDARAAQLAGFALMMKARADDRRLFERGVKLNVMAFEESGELRSEEVKKLVSEEGIAGAVDELVELFRHARTFGSLIQVPERLAEKLPALKRLSAASSQDLFVSEALKRLGPLVQQAELLASQYDAVVTNPPYMSISGMNAAVKEFAKDHFPDVESDLFACFIERGFMLARDAGTNAMVTMQGWMFLSSFHRMRERMLRDKTIRTMAHIGYNSFPSMNSKIAQATAFSILNWKSPGYAGIYINLNAAPQSADKEAVFLAKEPLSHFRVSAGCFDRIPRRPLAYWIPPDVAKSFATFPALSSVLALKAGMSTGNNELFQRLWHEVPLPHISFSYREKPARWVPCNSGGDYRKWFGNNRVIVDWDERGAAMRQYRNAQGNIGCAIRNDSFYFREGLTWTKISSGRFAARWMDEGYAFDDTGRSGFVINSLAIPENILAVMVSNFAHSALGALVPTLSFTSGELEKLPLPCTTDEIVARAAKTAVSIARQDWDLFERSWGFARSPLLTQARSSVAESMESFELEARQITNELHDLETEINTRINLAASLDSVTPEVPIEQITLTVNPAYRYGGKITAEEQWTRFRQDTMRELVSYAIGCAMGRYSQDEPGLIYAHSSNVGFDPSRYSTFPADVDGIIPITDTDWFDDDAAHRVVEFIGVAWGERSEEVKKSRSEEASIEIGTAPTSSLPNFRTSSPLEENLNFLAANLSPKKDESPRETVRRYLCDGFFKDHLQTYKNRPIYWCFTSGKQKAFQCLVYLHRYNEGTLARMRMEYVVPLQSKMAARIEKLGDDIQSASTGAQAKRLQKERDKLTKQLDELRRFDEQLRHYADQRIALDLDDGVKVNYGKFGDLLAEVKAVCGG